LPEFCIGDTLTLEKVGKPKYSKTDLLIFLRGEVFASCSDTCCWMEAAQVGHTFRESGDKPVKFTVTKVDVFEQTCSS
jgi:hypothetical protein